MFVVPLSLSFWPPVTQRSLEPVSMRRVKSERMLRRVRMEMGSWITVPADVHLCGVLYRA